MEERYLNKINELQNKVQSLNDELGMYPLAEGEGRVSPS